MTANRTLEVRGLTKSFPTTAGSLSVLSGIQLTLNGGQATAVTGPSGSGKSTLLYILGTLDSPTSGEVIIEGKNPFELNDRELASFRNEHVGFVFQDHHLLPQCSVLENVLIPRLPGLGANRTAEEAARELLNRVGLGERLTHRPAQLSGGERQRVAVCRALINEPAIVLADEPTGNLDEETAQAVGSLLLELSSERGVILVCVTHDIDLANRFPQRYHLHRGQLGLVDGEPKQVEAAENT